MATALHLDLVAEGVETRDQVDALLRLGVNHLQGFRFARPMPAAELTRLVVDAHRWSID
jgi:EAL domain-containing protein (putative c-di-GMP-specific phosphodiesterase class I)